jgi:hypothetical protein
MFGDKAERLLNHLGIILVDDLGYLPDRALLYAKVAENMVSAAIFTEDGNKIQYHWSSDKWTYPLLDLWEEAGPEQRWAELEYLVSKGKFHATFTYPEEIDPDEDDFARRRRIVRRHLGDKPIVYPPLPDGNEVFGL